MAVRLPQCLTSATLSYPHDKNEIAVCTAMAGEMLGMKLIYMDAEAGHATHNRKYDPCVSIAYQYPSCCGGGITSPKKPT
jgi:putative glycerol-1-phosphate prenyltransferase